jgi:cytochrome c oxidase subunit 2
LCKQLHRFITLFAFKYRGKGSKKSHLLADNNKLEAFIWSSIPAVVLAVLIFYGLYAWTDIMFVNEEEEKPIVELYAQQFKWLLDILRR